MILKFTGEGEILFFQKRVGRKGEIFYLIKFATMMKDSPNIGTGTITMNGDLRILPFGKFLRKTKINELPQLFNVFFGSMSIIGPRPLTKENFNLYNFKTQEILNRVKPGLSGIGSLVFRNEEEIMHDTKASLGFYRTIISPYKGSLEEWFVLKKGIITYFVLIILTVWIVLFPSSKIIWNIFKDLPIPPKELKKEINFPN